MTRQTDGSGTETDPHPLGCGRRRDRSALLARNLAFRLLKRWAAKTETRADDILLDAIRLPSAYWIVAVALMVGMRLSDLPDRHVFYLAKTIEILVILSVTIVSGKLASEIFRTYIRKAGLPIPETGIAYGILKGSIFLLGFLIILSALGISITPILTALGVGGLAVALALQETLSNLFAGIQVLVEKPIRIGDFVRLETDQEGYVEDITWRTTRIRMLPNNMVVVPNNKITQSILTNYHLPEKRMSLLITVGVGYESDPGRVETILVEEATRAVGEIPGLLGDPAPFVRFIPGFGASSLDFTLICQVGEFVDQYLVQHELRKRIFRRFREERIHIPFPQRTVHLKVEAGDAAKNGSTFSGDERTTR